jgi:hypothetical protein
LRRKIGGGRWSIILVGRSQALDQKSCRHQAERRSEAPAIEAGRLAAPGPFVVHLSSAHDGLAVTAPRGA